MKTWLRITVIILVLAVLGPIMLAIGMLIKLAARLGLPLKRDSEDET